MFRAYYSELAEDGNAQNVRHSIEFVSFYLLDFDAENPDTGEVPLVPLLYLIECSYPAAGTKFLNLCFVSHPVIH